MKITKYEHACLVIEEEGKRLVIDPGSYSSSLPELGDVVAVVVTHVHGDHFDLEKLAAIFIANPDAQLYTVPAVITELKSKFTPKLAAPDMGVAIGPFHLEFSGEKHAVIHPSVPTTDNVGVLVNDNLYYPGDSFTLPNKPVNILAAPAGSPWAKISEEMDFITSVKPKRVFPTHNAHLSDIGVSGRNNWLSQASQAVGAEYVFIDTGQTVEL